MNSDLQIPPWETHWFQLSDQTLLQLKGDLLRKLMCKAVRKAGNANKLSKKLKVSAPTLYNLINKKKIKMVSVFKLRRLLEFLEINFSELNSQIQMTKKGTTISINNPSFPMSLNNETGAYLLGLIISDGCIYVDKKSRDQIRTKYAAGEEQSETIFINTLNKIYGEVHIQREFTRNCSILRVGSSIIGNSLIKAGAPIGRKATLDPKVPWLVRQGSKEMKSSYLRAAFDDESSVYKEKKRNSGYIILSRYRHLQDLSKTQILELKEIEPLMKSRTFPTGHISKTIPLKKAVSLIKDPLLIKKLKKIPKLLQGEANLLDEFGIDNRFFGRCFTKTDAGRYSICVDLFISRKESLKKFYKHIGYSLDRKQEKLVNLVEGENEVKLIQHLNEEEGKICTFEN